MFRNLYADTRSILLSRAFRLALRAIAAYQVFYFILMKCLYVFLVGTALDADDIS